MEPRIQYAKTSDAISIAYVVVGDGPRIIVPSGIWGSLHLYTTGASAVAIGHLVSQGWCVITYDGRGCGASDRNIADFGLETRFLDLNAVIEHTHSERFALCGIVQGGPAAVLYAARNPDRVSALILSNTYVLGASWYEIVPAFRVSRATEAMVEDEWEYYTINMANAIRGHSDAESARELAKAFRSGMNAKDYVNYRAAVEQIDLTEVLTQIEVPTLVVHDKSFLVERVDQIARQPAKLVSNSRFVEAEYLGPEADAFLREVWTQPTPSAGGPSYVPSDAALRTVLFTDLVGHTEMMSRLGDERGRDVLREHERITREVLKANGGTEVKTMGDGFLASFGSVTKAVECAIALQRAFGERGGEPLSIRVGLNAGEPIEEDGDLFGATVILASRIAARAGADEILVSDNVRSLSAGKGFLFADRGEFVAKGIEEPVRVYEVSWR